MSALSFSDWLLEQGHVPDGVEVPPRSGVGGVLSALGPQTGSGRDQALGLWRQLHALHDEFCLATGTPRVTTVRASPMPEHSRRALAGVIAGSLC